MVQKKKDAACYKVSPCYIHRRNLWYEILKHHSEPFIIMGFILFVIIIMWFYLRIHFHPTVPLSHMVPLRTSKAHNTIYFMCVSFSHCRWWHWTGNTWWKISQYPCVWAIKQKLRLVTDTTDKVNNNFKSLFNADGVALGDIFQLKRAQILWHF